jgi:hypothetical protein
VTADELDQEATIIRSSFWHLPEQRSMSHQRQAETRKYGG